MASRSNIGAMAMAIILALPFRAMADEPPAVPAAPASPPPPAASDPGDSSFSPTDTFRLGKNQFTHGQYEEAITNITAVIYPLSLDSEDDVVEARRILAIAYYLTGRRDLATTEFTKLLYLRPLYKLDPFLVAPPIIEFFEQIRKKLKPQLDPLIMAEVDQSQQPNNALNGKSIRVEYHYNSRALTFFPFGIGQLQNGDRALGYTSLAIQTTALSLNITTAIIAYRSNNSYSTLLRANATGDDPWQKERLQELSNRSKAMMITNIISAAIFTATWFLSAVHANYRYVPYRMEISREEVDPSLLNGSERP